MKGIEQACLLGLPAGFAGHSPRNTFLALLGEAGTDAFTIMKLAGRSSVTVSGHHVPPAP
jgi:hypothetical protein